MTTGLVVKIFKSSSPEKPPLLLVDNKAIFPFVDFKVNGNFKHIIKNQSFEIINGALVIKDVLGDTHIITYVPTHTNDNWTNLPNMNDINKRF